MVPCARVRVGHARQEEDPLAEREGEKMSRLLIAVLMVLVYEVRAEAFAGCPPIFCGVQTPPGGSTGDATDDADTAADGEDEEESHCLETDSNETSILGHEVLSEVGDRVEVRFPVVGFIPGNVKEFRGWMPKQVFDRQCLDEASAITVGVYFHSDGVDGRFQTESLRLLSYIKRHKQPGELLIAIGRPSSFDRTPINHGREIDAQAMLIVYLHQTFGLGENIELYGHGPETIAIALTVNETNSVIKGVTAFPPVHDQDKAYHFLLHQRIKNLIRDGDNPQISIAHNPYEFGREGIEDFLAGVKELGLDVKTYEMVDRVVSDGSIPQEILAEIEDYLLWNRAYAREHLGLVPPGITVYIGNAEWLANRYLEAFELGEGARPDKVQFFSRCESAGEAGFYSIFIPVCEDRGWSAEQRETLVAHEWWHAAVQYYLLNSYCCTGSDRMQHTGPLWLIEGIAEALAKSVTAGVDFDLEREMAWLREHLRNRLPTDFNLLDLNTRKGWREASNYNYTAGKLAAFMLLDTAGLQSFLDFYGNLGDYYAAEAAKVGLDSTLSFGHNPELPQFSREFFDPPERLQKLDEIFQDAFGRTMEEFAKEFSEFLR